ncbi:hypothetical protein AT15_05495 [Kosmotoga arenicorallina S304]|uniref:VanZ-like domain-containing protein n=1 Tax=Kosmotoga arenicorallina S304 TaxID=1453497 RepID=A0A182C7Z4_9BACT|nr:hypothetical protein [Kosmotoga arenicorallina]OAA31528.1 hypothetical protein AT15_05495 [Kosmotoga arenicorallina S304]
MTRKTSIFLIISYFVFLLFLYFMPFSLSGNGRNSDKLVHFFIFACGGLLLVVIENSGNKKMLVFLGGAIFLSAFALEPIQGLLKYRVCDVKDAFSNFIGLGTVLLGYQFLKVAKRFLVFSLIILIPFYLFFSFVQLRGVFKESFGIPSHLFLDLLLYFSITYLVLIIGMTHKIKAVFWVFFIQILMLPLIINYLPFDTEYSVSYPVFSYSGTAVAAFLFFFLKKRKVRN